MVVKTVTTYVCDFCKHEFKDEDCLKNIALPVMFHTEQDEGNPCKPYLITEIMDLCQKCIDKIVILQGKGCMGHNTFYIKEKQVSKQSIDYNLPTSKTDTNMSSLVLVLFLEAKNG